MSDLIVKNLDFVRPTSSSIIVTADRHAFLCGARVDTRAFRKRAHDMMCVRIVQHALMMLCGDDRGTQSNKRVNSKTAGSNGEEPAPALEQLAGRDSKEHASCVCGPTTCLRQQPSESQQSSHGTDLSGNC